MVIVHVDAVATCRKICGSKLGLRVLYCIHKMNWMNSRNGCDDDSTLDTVICITIIVILLLLCVLS